MDGRQAALARVGLGAAGLEQFGRRAIVGPAPRGTRTLIVGVGPRDMFAGLGQLGRRVSVGEEPGGMPASRRLASRRLAPRIGAGDMFAASRTARRACALRAGEHAKLPRSHRGALGPTNMSAARRAAEVARHRGPWGRRTCPPHCRGRASPRGRRGDRERRPCPPRCRGRAPPRGRGVGPPGSRPTNTSAALPRSSITAGRRGDRG